jgi:hypothetical protein
MIDSLTAPFTSMYHLLVNIFIFIIVTVILMIVIPIIAIPILIKMFAIHLGRAIAIEVGKVATQIINEQRNTLTEKRINV